MGMMNNCCYRVKIHPRQTAGEGTCCLLCVGVGGLGGGHMLHQAGTGCSQARHGFVRPPTHRPHPPSTHPPTGPTFAPLRYRGRLCAAVRAPHHRGSHRGRLDEPGRGCRGGGGGSGEAWADAGRGGSGRCLLCCNSPLQRPPTDPPTLPFLSCRSRQRLQRRRPSTAAAPASSPWRRSSGTPARRAPGLPATARSTMPRPF